MSNRLVICDDVVGPWVAKRADALYLPGLTPSIGWLGVDRKLQAGALFTDYTQRNVMLHCASEGSHWLSREFLWCVFDYMFEQLGCERASGSAVGNNEKSVNLLLHLGFIFEAALKDVHPNGDVLLFKMYKKDCRWLRLRGSFNAKHLHRVGSD